MTHLGERITDFVFGGFSTAEMAEARQHLAVCADCRQQVDQFQLTHTLLRALPDVDPPRQIVFEAEKPRAGSWVWRWAGPMAAAAAVAMAVVTFAPRPAPQVVERVVQQLPAQPGAQSAAANIDYDRIISGLRDSERAWLVDELKMREAEQRKSIGELRGQLAYSDTVQREIWKYTVDNASSIQLLAAKRESGN